MQSADRKWPSSCFPVELVYRAAGDEGLAQKHRRSRLFSHPCAAIPRSYCSRCPRNPVQRLIHQHITHTVDKVVYRTEYQHVPCIDTSGQAFAIYLNLIYLAPLTGLFMRFFVKSYFRRTNPKAKHQSKHTPISKLPVTLLDVFRR